MEDITRELSDHRVSNNIQSEDEFSTDNSVVKIIWEHFSENRIEFFQQFTRILSIIFSFLCYTNALQSDGLWSTRVTRYQKALLAGASSHALSIHLTIDNIPSESGIFSLDSLHYLIYCYILCTSQPSLVALIPLFIWATLDLADYFYDLLNRKLPPNHHVIRTTVSVRENRPSLLQFVAYLEIFLGIVVVPSIFIADINFLILAYYKYLQYRYQSINNHSRIAFRRSRQFLEGVSQQPQCPSKVRELIEKIIDIVLRFSPSNVPDDIQ